jgi:tetratricopeptide (TPR) repeat protein
VAQNAENSIANAGLAIRTLDETLHEVLAGDLQRSHQPWTTRDKELLKRGMAFYEQYAAQNGVALDGIVSYQRLLWTKLYRDAMEQNAPHDEIDKTYRRAIEQAETVLAILPVANEPGEKNYQRIQARIVIARSHKSYANFLQEIGDYNAAMQHYLKAQDTYQRLHKAIPSHADYAYSLGVTHYNIAVMQTPSDRAKAEASFRAAQPLFQQAADTKPNLPHYRHDLAKCQYNLGHLLGDGDRRDESRELWEKSLGLWRQLAGEYPETSEYYSRLGATLSNLGALAWQREDLDSARQMLEEAIAIQKRALAKRPVYGMAQQFLETHYQMMGRVLKAQGDNAALLALDLDRTASRAKLQAKAAQPATPTDDAENE